MVGLSLGPVVCKNCARNRAPNPKFMQSLTASKRLSILNYCVRKRVFGSLQFPLVVWEDNAACLYLGHGLKGSKAAKHFQVRLRFLNEQVQGNVIEFAKIDTKDQLADGFTKALPGPLFFAFRELMLHSPSY